MTGGSFDGVYGEVIHTAGGVGIDPEERAQARAIPRKSRIRRGDLVSATPPSRIS
jgi:hypothetical protein